MSKRRANLLPRFVKATFIQPAVHSLARRLVLILALIIFVTTLGLRLIVWHYWSSEALKVQTTVSTNYKRFARMLVDEGMRGYFRADSAMSHPDLLGHPPGYPFLLAILMTLGGNSDTLIQLFQITADALAAVFLFLIALELLGDVIGMISGVLAAMSPQFSWNALLVLPDTLSVLPLLAAVYLIVRARKRTRAWLFFLAGLLIGVSCLLRPNNLLLAPFLALLILLAPAHLFVHKKWRQRAGLAAIMVAGSVLVIAPVTIRNAIVFGEFVPLSLGAGQTLLEGIADYDAERRFGLPNTDVEIAEMEAREQQRSEYAETLFGPDGIKRERSRLTRGLNVIASNPFWFVGVTIQRAASMLRFERVPVISVEAGRTVGYPSFLRVVQKIFLTAFMLPLALLGAILLTLARRWSILFVLLAVPLYYFIFQSALHTEYRYTLALNYFLLVLAATTIHSISKAAFSKSQTSV